MRYVAIGHNDDGTDEGSFTVRMFMDDGRVFDDEFKVHVPTFEECLDGTVGPRMRELAQTPPLAEHLADPNIPIGEVEGPAPAPDTAVEVT